MNVWLETTAKVCDLVAPQKSFTKKAEAKYIPWFTPEIVNLSIEKASLLTTKRKDRHPDLQNKLREVSNRLKNLKRRHKRQYFSSKIENEKNSKKLWDILKDATNSTKQREDVEPENINKEKANSFNEYFANVGKRIQQQL